MIRSLVTHSRPPRHLAEAQGAETLLVDQPNALRDQSLLGFRSLHPALHSNRACTTGRRVSGIRRAIASTAHEPQNLTSSSIGCRSGIVEAGSDQAFTNPRVAAATPTPW